MLKSKTQCIIETGRNENRVSVCETNLVISNLAKPHEFCIILRTHKIYLIIKDLNLVK